MNFEQKNHVSPEELEIQATKIENLHSIVNHLDFKNHKQDKWVLDANGETKEPNDDELLDYHYNRLIRKYDVPYEHLKDVKDLCLKFLEKNRIEQKNKELRQALKIQEQSLEQCLYAIEKGVSWLSKTSK